MVSDYKMITNEDNESSLLDFFTKIISHPPSCLESLPIKEEPLSEEDFKVLQKAGRKKQNHNIIERRRRHNINERIKELAELLPKKNERYYDTTRDVARNKGSILTASVAYIKQLQEDQRGQERLEERCRMLTYQNDELMFKLKMRAAELQRLPGSDWGGLYPSKESEEESEDRVRLVRLSDPLLSSSASSIPSEL